MSLAIGGNVFAVCEGGEFKGRKYGLRIQRRRKKRKKEKLLCPSLANCVLAVRATVSSKLVQQNFADQFI